MWREVRRRRGCWGRGQLKRCARILVRMTTMLQLEFTHRIYSWDNASKCVHLYLMYIYVCCICISIYISSMSCPYGIACTLYVLVWHGWCIYVRHSPCVPTCMSVLMSDIYSMSLYVRHRSIIFIDIAKISISLCCNKFCRYVCMSLFPT